MPTLKSCFRCGKALMVRDEQALKPAYCMSCRNSLGMADEEESPPPAAAPPKPSTSVKTATPRPAALAKKAYRVKSDQPKVGRSSGRSTAMILGIVGGLVGILLFTIVFILIIVLSVGAGKSTNRNDAANRSVSINLPAEPAPVQQELPVRQPPVQAIVPSPVKPVLPPPVQPVVPPPLQPQPVRHVDTIADWGKVIDPDGDCAITAEGKALVVRVPKGSHDLVPGRLNGPRVLQEVSGDFRIEVRVVPAMGSGGYQSAGLFVWGGDRDYIRYEAVHGFNSNGMVEYRAAGRGTMVQSVRLPPNPYLCLERRGDLLTPFYSTDGKTWIPQPPLKVSLPKTTNVGVGVVSSGGGEWKTQFEDLRLEAK